MRTIASFALSGIACLALATPSMAGQPVPIKEEMCANSSLVVHLGCKDGTRTASLLKSDTVLVHALDRDAEEIAHARRDLAARGIYGRVSAELLKGNRLPYADNMVNAIVCDAPLGISHAEMIRVLAPGGTLWTVGNGAWESEKKEQPASMDEWTHALYDASGNAAGKDTEVGGPRRLRWTAGPTWNRGVKTSAMVSAGGRIFYIQDIVNGAAHPQETRWSVIARDAHNGLLLWQRQLKSWDGNGHKKVGPETLYRRLVAIGDRVYVTLGHDQPVFELDAAMGETLRTYDETGAAEEIIVSGEMLLTVTNTTPPKDPAHITTGEWMSPAAKKEKSIVAVNRETGSLLWKKQYPQVTGNTLAVKGPRVFAHSESSLVCLELQTGKQLWAAEATVPSGMFSGWYTPTVVAHDQVVLYAVAMPRTKKKPQAGRLFAFSADTGELLWQADCPASGYMAPIDMFVMNGLAWTVDHGRLVFAGRDLLSGELIESHSVLDRARLKQHARCHRIRVSGQRFISGKQGVEIYDPAADDLDANNWVRGSCHYGIMPAYGLIYQPQHHCACYMNTKINGFNALAAAPDQQPRVAPEPRQVEQGPAFTGKPAAVEVSVSDDWPVYRHDPARSAGTESQGPSRLAEKWRAELGGRLSAPVIFGEYLYVASPDRHRVHALSVSDGSRVWSYVAGGRVDSPPTCYQGDVYFGSADGYVYCLRAKTGELVWRNRAAPQITRIVARGQLESKWPVHGSVVVKDGTVYCTAGRSSYLDGGIHLLRLNAHTGELLSETVIDARDPKTGKEPVWWDTPIMPGGLQDVLVVQGDRVYLKDLAFDLKGTLLAEKNPHFISTAGFLDDSWWLRGYWIYAPQWTSADTGAGSWYRHRWRFPSGRILAESDGIIYGYGDNWPDPKGLTPSPGHYYGGNPTKQNRGGLFRFFAARKEPLTGEAAKRISKEQKMPADLYVDYAWTHEVPVQIWSIVPAANHLYVAGLKGKVYEDSELKLASEEGPVLWIVDKATGKTLQETTIPAAPIWDGVTVARNALFLVSSDGTVTCYKE